MDAYAQIAGVLAVVALLGLIWWLSRHPGVLNLGPVRLGSKVQSPVDPNRPTVLSRVQLAPGHQLHVVQVFDRRILIATHPAGSSVLVQRPAAVNKAAASQAN